MSANEIAPYGYGLVITHWKCSDILPVDSEGRAESYEKDSSAVPVPGAKRFNEFFVHTTDDGVRLVTLAGRLAPTAALWSLRPEPLEWYRDRVEHLCLDNQDIYNEMEEVTAWA